MLASDLPDLGPGREGACSLLAVPLHYESRVSGVICLVARGANHFDDDDLRLLQILSDQAAVAIENARLMAGRDQLVHELGALLEMSQAASTASDETDLARRLAGWMRKATGAEAAIVSRWDDDSTVLRELWREGVSGPQTQIDVADSPARRGVLREGRPVADPRRRRRPDKLARGPATPRHRREVAALPAIERRRPDDRESSSSSRSLRRQCWTRPRCRRLEAIASLAATGLEKVRLLDQLRSAADMDLVTGVHNHRYLQERLRQEVARSARSHSPFAC